jgi:hypothetical protein
MHRASGARLIDRIASVSKLLDVLFKSVLSVPSTHAKPRKSAGINAIALTRLALSKMS